MSASYTARMKELESLVFSFVNQLSAKIEGEVMSRVRANVDAVLGGNRVAARSLALVSTGRPRKQMPVQLCPVPGCKNRAAPVFGMVCSEHKNVSKTKIRQYRQARREAKGGKAKSTRRAVATKTVTRSRKTARPKTKVSPAKRTARPVSKRAPARKRAARPAKAVASTASAATTSAPQVAAAS